MTQTSDRFFGSARKSRQRAFTLIELLVVIAISGIILSMAVQNMDIVRSYRLSNAASEIHTAFMLARSEAIKRNATVIVSPTTANWVDGWTIAVSGGDVIQTAGKLSDVAITASFTGPLSMGPTGRVNVAATFTIAPVVTGAPGTRCVRIASTGRVEVTIGACS